ncbi:RNA-directed DNA polymerase, eukaryota, reverse transcriptase zinc-binding domain protein [Tanacetum coccineum]
MARVNSWDPVVEKFSNRLSTGKLPHLFHWRRATLITSIRFSILMLPSTVNKKLETLRSNFIWGSADNSHKIPWISWNVVLASKDKGGLGFGSLYSLTRSPFKYGDGEYLTNRILFGPVDHCNPRRIYLHGTIWATAVGASLAYISSKRVPFKPNIRLIHARMHAQALTLVVLSDVALYHIFGNEYKKLIIKSRPYEIRFKRGARIHTLKETGREVAGWTGRSTTSITAECVCYIQ